MGALSWLKVLITSTGVLFWVKVLITSMVGLFLFVLIFDLEDKSEPNKDTWIKYVTAYLVLINFIILIISFLSIVWSL